MQRLSRYYGLKDPVRVGAKSRIAKPLDQAGLDELRKYFPVMPSAAIPEPMSPEEFRKRHG